MSPTNPKPAHPYRIRPLSADFLDRLRCLGEDALQQGPELHTAAGGEPCRDVLRRARPGERLLLASYSPFSRPGPYREYGPIYLLAEPGNEAVDYVRLPWGADSDYFATTFVLRAYSADERIVDACLTEPTSAERELERLLARPGTDFVLARFAAYGCFGCRIERQTL